MFYNVILVEATCLKANIEKILERSAKVVVVAFYKRRPCLRCLSITVFILNIVKRCFHVWSAALCPECLAFNKHREPRTQNDQKCAQEDLLIVWPAQSRSPASLEFPHNRTMDGLNYTRCLHTGLQIESIAFVHL